MAPDPARRISCVGPEQKEKGILARLLRRARRDADDFSDACASVADFDGHKIVVLAFEFAFLLLLFRALGSSLNEETFSIP